MMRTNLSVLFFLKKPKNYRQGDNCFRITVDGVRSEMSTGRNCEPQCWNAKSGKVIGNREAIKTLNALLEKMKTDVFATYTLLSIDNEEITADSIKHRYLGKEDKSHTLLEAISIHNKKIKELVEKEEYAVGTLKRLRCWKGTLKNILPQNMGNAISV